MKLRRSQRSDLIWLHALDNDAEVMRWINGGEEVDLQTYEQSIFPVFDESRETEHLGFFVVEVEDDPVGWVCMRQTDDAEASLGYRFKRSTWGKGYATRASEMAMTKAFDSGIRRIRASTYEKNEGSLRVMQKLGMQFSRRFRLDSDDLQDTSVSSGDLWDGDEIEYEIYAD